MKTKIPHILLAVAAFGAAAAGAQTPVPQPPTERTGSPYDTNPACRDRDVPSTDPACVIQNGPPAVRSYGAESTAPKPPVAVQPPAPVIIIPPQDTTRR